MNRRSDWMERLHSCVENARLLPFRYGTHDCCLWAAHCVDSMCDTQIANQIVSRFTYYDEATANAAIQTGGGLHKLVTEFLGDPVSGKLAAPGDVAIVRDDTETALLGVVVGHAVVVPSSGAEGLTRVPYDRIVMCWKV